MSELWKAERDGKVIGQFTFEQLVDLAKSGVLLPFDRLTDPSHGKPVLAKNIPELFSAPVKQEDPEEGPPKLWSPVATTAWGILFSVIFPSILLAINWYELRNYHGVTRCLVWIVGTCLFFVVGPTIIPNFDALSWMLSMAFLFAFAILEAQPQVTIIKDELKGQYRRRSWLIPLTVAFVCVGIGVYASQFGATTTP